MCHFCACLQVHDKVHDGRCQLKWLTQLQTEFRKRLPLARVESESLALSIIGNSVYVVCSVCGKELKVFTAGQDGMNASNFYKHLKLHLIPEEAPFEHLDEELSQNDNNHTVENPQEILVNEQNVQTPPLKKRKVSKNSNTKSRTLRSAKKAIN